MITLSVFVFFCIFFKRKGLTINPLPTLSKEGFFYRVCVKFPYMLAYDLFHREKDSFPEFGFHLIVGEQGSGKTITATYLLNKYKECAPLCRIRTNCFYKYQDSPINDWRDLVFSNNGVHGEIDFLDEIQNWFSSMQSKDFPVEMLQEITQQRKQRKVILGTAQVWQRVAKPLREQVMLLYKPFTLFGCLTIVPVYKPVVNDDGQAERLKFRKIFFFVHDNYLRDSYDTYRKIAMNAKQGFISNPLRNTQDINITSVAK